MNKKNRTSASIMRIIGISLILVLIFGVSVIATEIDIRSIQITMANGYTMNVVTTKTNVEEILDKLEPHFPQYTRIHRTTYFRWREQAFEAVGSILWGYEGESERILKLICKDYEEK